MNKQQQKEEMLKQQKAAKRRKILIGVGIAVVCIAVVAAIFAAIHAGGKAAGPTSSGSEGNTNMWSTKTNNDVHIEKMFTPPAKGEEIAVMTTSMGTIKIKFFPEDAPKAVENFKGLAKKGYYNGITFHRVINNFMIQSGSPDGSPGGGESLWGSDFQDEFSYNLYNFRGALSMANVGQPNTNSSQFFIVQAPSVPDTYLSTMTSIGVPSKIVDKYQEIGGTPWLDGTRTIPIDISQSAHTVFGYVFEGMDVVDKIAAVPVVDPTTQNYKPVTDVILESVEIVPYAG